MHLTYSALRRDAHQPDPETKARFRGYQAACKKHQQTIAAIRQYLPGWMPPFVADSHR
jgi:hypothetical protein